MSDFINHGWLLPVELYKSFYVLLTTLSLIFVWFFCLFNKNFLNKNFLFISNYIGWFVFLILFLLISFRPVHYLFGDMVAYDIHFENYKGLDTIKGGDLLFEILLFSFSKNFNSSSFFFFCTVIYFFTLYISYKKFFKDFWAIAFLLSCSVITFYGFAVNGIRNGIAAHIFLIALSYNKRFSWIILIISIGLHSSMILPTIGYVLYKISKNLSMFLVFWFLCLIVSLFYSGFGDLIQFFGFSNDRLNDYLNAGDTYSDQFSKEGYRYDFILYGFLPILVSSYYIFRRKFVDENYNTIVAVYLFSNSIFLLLNEVAFSNRFAYLSWFLIGIIIFYPIYHLRESRDKNIFLVSLGFLLSINFIVNY
ncbi:EpsG family protein [Acinetobacter pseudolwoffii]|uniref:EpsG family protein n=1 Tax=Acinetobacter pseudolwoffii TaxID=2053287 RepID=UPI0025766C31|nr:EpsG family protein [Acinetobacter pseudolwoffii]MDM1335777.1 EpsG family protein [Acinetobacter pseudolwoffii]